MRLSAWYNKTRPSVTGRQGSVVKLHPLAWGYSSTKITYHMSALPGLCLQWIEAEMIRPNSETFMLLQSLSVYDIWKAFSSLCFSVRGCPAALAVCSEAYFSAVAKMGDQALHTLSSRSLGKCVCVCDCVWDWSLSLSITGFALNLLHQFNRIVL